MTNRLRILALFALVFSVSFSAHAALTDVCVLKDQPVEGIHAHEEIKNYRNKLESECDLKKKYEKVTERLLRKFDVRPEQVTIYQAMRYVERHRIADAKYSETPLPLIYQKMRTDYQKPNSEKSEEIWHNFLGGISQLAATREAFLEGTPFSLQQLLKIHKGYYTVSDEKGDFTHEPNPGEIKPESTEDMPWWPIKDDGSKAQNIVDLKNSIYRSMDLLPNLKGDQYINNVMNIKPTATGYSLYSGDTRANRHHLENIFSFMNTMVNKARQGQHMEWQGRLMTPAELAYFVQQFYVEVHAFSEGNGRTSRFLQELILTSFGLPHGSSGDLMDIDVLTPHDEYYRIAIAKNSELLTNLQDCIDTAYRMVLGPFSKSKDLVTKDQSGIEYSCRILK